MTQDIHAHRILILDFGSQYSQLIARRVRELGVYCELRAYDMTDDEIREFAPKGIILSGGPESVTEAGSPRAADVVFTLGVPVLGICYGMQTMAQQLGGQVQSSNIREFGYAEVTVVSDLRQCVNNAADTRHDAFFGDIKDRRNGDGESTLDVWMSHGDKVTQVPDGFRVTASTPSCPIAAMADEARDFYGLQFHPEVTHTSKGLELLQRFVHDICQTQALWTPENIIEDSIRRVREQVGHDQVLLGLSGGVDSSVVAALLHKAIGDQLTCVFVDNGLLRKNEGEQVMAMFAKNMGIKVIRVDAEDEFLGKLAGVSDPEAKRKAIGNTFIDVFDRESGKLAAGGVNWLAQGTIYPDVIESAASKTGKAHVIKSHHNVGGLPENMKMKLVEPLRELFK
ncbi:MAG: glutamine-hydrolyzing GMP synthase, partial [Moraxellaceae bacterium]|nr:glutamine-hydrolyzing GMP synthase [Moraxellaceae bacterium]